MRQSAVRGVETDVVEGYVCVSERGVRGGD